MVGTTAVLRATRQSASGMCETESGAEGDEHRSHGSVDGLELPTLPRSCAAILPRSAGHRAMPESRVRKIAAGGYSGAISWLCAGATERAPPRRPSCGAAAGGLRVAGRYPGHAPAVVYSTLIQPGSSECRGSSPQCPLEEAVAGVHRHRRAGLPRAPPRRAAAPRSRRPRAGEAARMPRQLMSGGCQLSSPRHDDQAFQVVGTFEEGRPAVFFSENVRKGSLAAMRARPFSRAAR